MFRFSFPALVAGWLASSVALVTVEAAADAVVLKDGRRLEGKVRVQELGKYVVIELPGGVQKTVMWEDLKEVDIAAEAAPPEPAETVKPSPEAAAEVTRPKHRKKLDRSEFSGEVTRSGAAVSVVHDCGEGQPACHGEATVRIAPGDVRATYDAVEDCSPGAGEVCKRTTNATAGQDGLNITITTESAQRVTGPPKTGGTQIGLSGSVLFATGEMIQMTGFTAGLNVRFLSGPEFPDETGGSWTGFFVEPAAQLSYTRTVIEMPDLGMGMGGEEISSSSGGVMLNATGGLQWMSFGALDEETVQQRGWGVAVGGQVGRLIPFEGDGSTTYGAALNLLFPKYNPGTGAFVTEQINLFLLPTSKMFFLLAGYQKSWG